MESSTSDSETLQTRFNQALAVKQQLDSLVPVDAEYGTKLQSARNLLLETRRQADAVGIFSPNETLDDVATADLLFFQIDYHLADLSTKTPTSNGPPDPGRRAESLRQAQDYYGNFLTRVDQYDLLSRTDEQLLERWRSDRDSFELLATAGTDGAARRGQKIARYQVRKQLEQKVKQLEASRPIDISSAEESQREAELAQLALAIHESFDALDMLAVERRLLRQAASYAPPPPQQSNTNDPRLDPPTQNSTYSERLDPSLRTLARGRGGPLLDPRGKPTQPFVLTDARQQIRDGVFRSGHRLPTMSIDEYLEAERARGGIIEGGGEQSGQPRQVDEDDEAAADRETERQRAWDEFKENNPKGSGNTLNRG